LVLGYLTLLSAIGAAAWCGLYALRQSDFKPKHRLVAVLIGGAAGLFFLGFFSLHFGAFHAGHSVFLRGFFPIESLPKDGFGAAFMNPPLLWKLVLLHLMKPYGLFLIPAIIAERQHVFLPLIRAVKAVRAGNISQDPFAAQTEPNADKKSSPLGDVMGRPYINVIRMHLLIFFFAFCHFLKVDSFLVFAVVYTVYFFPWNEMKQLRGGIRNERPQISSH
jgi:hypothetical protein